MNAPSVAVRRPAVRRWGVTLTATAVSTYALDAVATAAGVALAASQLLNGLSHELVLAFLAATYVAWGAGLKVNLAANCAAARADRHQHERALEGAVRPRQAHRPAHAPDRGRDRLRGHRADQGGALLRGRVRRRARHATACTRTTR